MRPRFRCRSARMAALLPLVATLSCAAHPWAENLTELAHLVDLEEQRPPEAVAELEGFLGSPEPWLRARATRALGRIGIAEAVVPLCRALADQALDVRLEAAFALGQLREGTDSAVGALLPLLRSPEPALRARAAEALGKIASITRARDLLPLLGDPAAEVRGAAALGLHRARARALTGAAGKDAPDLDAPLRDGLIAALSREGDAQARWRLVYALAALRSEGAVDALIAATTDAGSPWTRLFAARGLAAVLRRHPLEAGARGRVRRALLQKLEDPEPGVVIEAILALGDPSPGGRDGAERGVAAPFAEKEVLDAIAGHIQDSHPQVAAAAAQAIGHFGSLRLDAQRVLSLAEASEVPTVKAKAIEASARLLGDAYAGILDLHGRGEDWRRRAAVARALRFLTTRVALDLARGLLQDNDRRVRLEALVALRHCKENRDALTLTLAALEDRDPATRETVAETLAVVGDTSALAAMRRFYLDSAGSDFADARTALVRAVTRLGRNEPETRSFLEQALKDPAFAVREAAHAGLQEVAPGEPLAVLVRPAGHRVAARPGKDYAPDFLAARPVIRLRTSKGDLLVELAPDAAATHCFNLLHQIRRGAYDGRSFHRVVANFVVQGGDPRGDGFGGHAWWGGYLRLEVSPLPFLAGTLGMPRGSDPDSGGEQIFLTCVPTPHLDGAYTAFGRLIEGLDVLSRIEVGDRIEKAEVVSEG